MSGEDDDGAKAAAATDVGEERMARAARRGAVLSLERKLEAVEEVERFSFLARDRPSLPLFLLSYSLFLSLFSRSITGALVTRPHLNVQLAAAAMQKRERRREVG